MCKLLHFCIFAPQSCVQVGELMYEQSYVSLVPFFSHLECNCYCHSCVGAWSGCWTGCVGRGGGCDFNTVASPTVLLLWCVSCGTHTTYYVPSAMAPMTNSWDFYLHPSSPTWLLCISLCSCIIPSHCMWVCHSGELSDSVRVVAPGCIATSDAIV